MKPKQLMHATTAICSMVLVALAPARAADGKEADWKPVLDESKPQVTADTGRVIDTYTAPAREGWGYTPYSGRTPADQGRDVLFYVVHPEKARQGAPLYVVLHSAGHISWTALTAGFNRSADGSYNDHGLYHAPDDAYGLYLSGDSWWGRDVPGKPEDFTNKDTPVEGRVLDTIAWVIAKYGIDPNRVSLAGISMGGSGALGIGMRHGEIFASMMVWVPAGTKHVARRMFFDGQIPDGVSIADPPVVIDMSAQNDTWSDGQEVLIRNAAAGKYAFVFGWGPFGHAGVTKTYLDFCGPVAAFPWLDVRKDQAYPVFTGASTDQKPPWPKGNGGDEKGQINAYFRWKNLKDTATAFSMQLWLEPQLAATAAVEESVADVTFRRLQHFKVPAGKKVAFELVRDGKTLSTGTIQPDAAGLLTIPKQTITPVPAEVRLTVK